MQRTNESSETYQLASKSRTNHFHALTCLSDDFLEAIPSDALRSPDEIESSGDGLPTESTSDENSSALDQVFHPKKLVAEKDLSSLIPEQISVFEEVAVRIERLLKGERKNEAEDVCSVLWDCV